MCGQFLSEVKEKELTLKSATTKEITKKDYGVLVWAGGIGARPFTKVVASQIGGPQMPVRKGGDVGPIRGLKVDSKFRVFGTKDVWAIGDCALSGAPPTAQAAYQQGTYLGRLFRSTEFEEEKLYTEAAFEFHNYGSLAYVGSSRAVADLKMHLWGYDHPAGRGQDVVVEGNAAFAIWRSLYFSKVLSFRNRAQVVFDWATSAIFGRDISAPYNERNQKK